MCPWEALRALCFVGQLPREYGTGSAGMVEQDLSDCSEPFCARPIALQFSGHTKPGDGLGPRGDNTADRHVVCFRRDAARRVGHGVHVVAVAHRVEGGLRKTHLRPECRDDQLLAAGVLHGLDDAAVLPGVDEGAVDGLLIRKDRLDLLENLTAAFRVDGGEKARDAARVCGLSTIRRWCVK